MVPGIILVIKSHLQHFQDKQKIPMSNCEKCHFNGKTSILRSSDQNMIFKKL